MKQQTPKPTGRHTARFCIWTIDHQDHLLRHFRIYMVTATLLVLLLHLAGFLGTGTALGGLFIGGLSVLLLMGFLIRARKKSLMHIEDPVLRRKAHEAMIAYLSRKRLNRKDKTKILKSSGRRLYGVKP